METMWQAELQIMARRLEVQLRLQMLDGSEHIRIPGFLPAFKVAYDMNRIHESTAMW